MEASDVTLIIPCYNVADSLPEVLDAVDALSPAPGRVLCIDDGSTDETAAIVSARDGIELVENAENRGLGVTLNRGLAHTRTPWLAKIDGDVVVEPDWLARICEHGEREDADLVCGRFVEQVTTTADKWRAKYPSPPFPDEPLYNIPINGANILGRVDALQHVGGWDEQYRRAHDDIDLIQRLIYRGFRVYYTPDVKTTHVRTDTWREVLRTAWAYQADRNPGRLRDVLDRLPQTVNLSARGVYKDVRDRDLDILPISVLRLFFHLKWDVEAALASNGDDDEWSTGPLQCAGVAVERESGVLTDRIEWLLRYGVYELEETEFVEAYVEPSMDVVELGGGIGYLSCFIDARGDGDRTHVVVEPNQHLLPVLERNRELNGASFTTVAAAYASEGELVDLHVPEEFWSASLHPMTDEHETVAVATVDLRSIVERYELTDVALVVDAEGSEADLLLNELDVVESHCRVLIVEFHDDGSEAGHSDRTARVRERLERRSFERLAERNGVAVYRPPSGTEG